MLLNVVVVGEVSRGAIRTITRKLWKITKTFGTASNPTPFVLNANFGDIFNYYFVLFRKTNFVEYRPIIFSVHFIVGIFRL